MTPNLSLNRTRYSVRPNCKALRFAHFGALQFGRAL